MIKYTEIKQNSKQFLSLTSLSLPEFDDLLVTFKKVWEYQMRYFTFSGKERQRKYREKQNSKLSLAEDKLLFILYYLKTHPLQESLAASFGMTQPQANSSIHRYKKVLYQALEEQNCLPARNAAALKKRLESSEETEFYTDGVERSIPRSTDWDVQKDNYSGKKKSHTNKNTLFSGSDAQIHYLSDTYEGKTHDKRINEESAVELPKGSQCYQDTGFVGYAPKGENVQIIMPAKKPKGKTLNHHQKAQNTLIAKIRVKVEHVMSGIKKGN